MATNAISHARKHLVTSVNDHDPTGLTASQLLRLNSGATAVESSGKVAPSGDIVGTSDTQNLTNKSIDYRNNTVSLGSYARVYLGSNQNITANVITKVSFDTESWDKNGEFDSTTDYDYTVGTPGEHHVEATIRFSVAADQDGIGIFIYKNGSEHSRTSLAAASASSGMLMIADDLTLSANDVIDIRVRNSNNNDTIEAGSNFSRATFRIISRT